MASFCRNGSHPRDMEMETSCQIASRPVGTFHMRRIRPCGIPEVPEEEREHVFVDGYGQWGATSHVSLVQFFFTVTFDRTIVRDSCKECNGRSRERYVAPKTGWRGGFCIFFDFSESFDCLPHIFPMNSFCDRGLQASFLGSETASECWAKSLGSDSVTASSSPGLLFFDIF
jgi:hypothetical protein